MLPEEILRKVRLIEISTRKVVDDVLTGQYRSHFKGQGVQFSEHRLYVPGDDVRHIDWKVSARTREPLIKKYDEERELTVFIVVDVSGSQAFGSSDKLKSQIAAEVGGMLAYAATHTGDRVGVLIFAGEVERIIPPKKGRQHVLRVIRDLLTHQPTSKGTDLAGALEATGRIMKHGGVVFIISDFIAKGYDIPLKRLARKHDVVAIRVEDERERVIPELGQILLFNPETGEENLVDTSSYQFKKWLKDYLAEFDTDIRTAFKGGRVEKLSIITKEDYGEAVVRFFERARAESAKNLVLGSEFLSVAMRVALRVTLRVVMVWTVASGVTPFSFAATALPAAVSPAASDTPQAKEPDLLMLPGFDLERAEGAVRVGDHLVLKMPGLRVPGISNPKKELSLQIPASVNLGEEGWSLSTENVKGDLDGKSPDSDFVIIASPLKPGKLTLPSLALKNSAGNAVARTNPFNLEVVSAIQPNDPKPEQPEELEPPVGLRFPWWIVIGTGVVVLLVVAGAVYGLIRWFKGRKAKKKKVPEVVRREDETAMLKLAELEQMALIQRGEFKAYYFRLSEILKAYVGGRYRFEAPECTTREMLSTLEDKKAIADFIVDRLEKMFERLDLVKFTDHFPAMEEPALLIQETKEFVMSTRRSQSVAPESVGSYEVR